MTDPSHALQSFQQVFLTGGMELRPGVLDSKLYLHVDDADGLTRFTYVRLEGQTITAFVLFTPCAPIEGRPCFAIGYAVPEAYRNQGRAKEAVGAALAEMRRGFGRVWPLFYVEAIVGIDNKPSQRVAEQAISDTPIAVTDQVSGLPAFQYVLRIERSAI
jgi:hypothetical protein